MSNDESLRLEQEFFDREAAELLNSDLRFAPRQIERYQRARIRSSNIPKDTLFALLNPLEGKRVLDYGCGHGENACLLAACGAQVSAFDLSPGSIEVAKKRAEVVGVADRIEFSVQAAGQLDYESGSFDVIMGEAILHHLHTMLDVISAELDRILKPQGQIGFIEPVANSALLRTLRRLTPVSYDTTPDERQMYYEDFNALKPYFPHLEFHHFYALERLHRVLPLNPAQHDRARRRLRLLDYHAQRRWPIIRPLYGTMLIMASR